MKKRIVIAGLGDTGLLVAIHLGRGFEVVGISPKAGLVSGQELGTRLTRPEEWKRSYLMPFDRYKRLDGVRTVQGRITELDPEQKIVTVELPDGRQQTEPYDILILSPGVTNGFWRNAAFESLPAVADDIARASAQLSRAKTVAVIGGGATGVSVSGNLAEQHPETEVHFFYSGERPLPGYHPRVRKRIEHTLERAGVQLHPGHRAVIPDGFRCDTLTTAPVHWSTGQPPFRADLALWSVGRSRPNTAFIPRDMLDEDGFVETDDTLRVPGYPNVFAVGDAAATDPHRSSARNWGYRLVAHNVRVLSKGNGSKGNESAMRRFSPPAYRWGSILGVQKDGMRVFQPDGRSFRFSRWWVDRFLFPIAVRRVIYRGVRKAAPDPADAAISGGRRTC